MIVKKYLVKQEKKYLVKQGKKYSVKQGKKYSVKQEKYDYRNTIIITNIPVYMLYIFRPKLVLNSIALEIAYI